MTEDSILEVAVDVYVLWVAEEGSDWPEREQRSRRWFSMDGAADAVEEPQLKALLRAIGDARRGR